jgi:hypothetical protein
MERGVRIKLGGTRPVQKEEMDKEGKIGKVTCNPIVGI